MLHNRRNNKRIMYSILFITFVSIICLCIPTIRTMACGGSTCSSVTGTQGACTSGCSGGTCYAFSLNNKCVGHHTVAGPDSSAVYAVKESEPTESNRVYVKSEWSSVTNIDTGKQSRVRTDYYKVTYATKYQNYQDVDVVCDISGCSLKFFSTEKIGDPYYTYETKNETETSDEYRIRSVVNVYLQKSDGSWGSSPDSVVRGNWGEWYGDYTDLAKDYVGSNLPKKGASNVKATFTGWSRNATGTHYPSNTHTSATKTDKNITARTITDSKRTWTRYIYRKQYYLRLWHNKPSNASTTLNYMNPTGTTNHASGSGAYAKYDSYYQRLSYVGERFYVPKTYETYQMIGYASRNTWYTAIKDGAAVGEGANMTPLSSLSGWETPSSLYAVDWYAQWFSEPGKLYLMPNSSGIGTDSCFGAYIDDSSTQNDTYLYDSRQKDSGDTASRP